jgi:hypothetical protein
MARLHFNGLAAELAADVDDTETTFSFAAALTHSNGQPVPTLGAGEEVALSVLNGSGQLAEIVLLTAYTEGDTDGTVTRAQESTTGVAHTAGVTIVNAWTVADIGAGGGGGGGWQGAWAAGSYPDGSLVTHSGYLFGAHADTTEEPQLDIVDYSQDFAVDLPPEGALWDYSGSDAPNTATVERISGATVSGSGTVPDWCLSITDGSSNVNSRVKLTLEFSDAGTIEFDSAMDNGNAGFEFYIDGVQQLSVGNHGWTHRGPYAVTAGVHEFEWEHSKGSFFSGGTHAAFANVVTVGSVAPASVDWDPIVAV